MFKSDLEALTAYVVANPNDAGGWCVYSDHCRDLGNEAWADLAQLYAAADADGRAKIMAEHYSDWPPMTQLTMIAMHNAFAIAGNKLVETFRAAGEAIGRAMAPMIEAMRRMGSGMAEAAEPGEQPSPPSVLIVEGASKL